MNKFYKIVFAAIFLWGICAGAFAQIEHGGTPYSFKEKSVSTFTAVALPAMENQRLLQEETAADDKQEGYPFGKEIAVDYRLDNSGTWEDLPDGGRLWRLGIESKGAYSINLLFDRFYIPPASHLFIYTADKSFVLGSFTEKNNNRWGNFATTLLPGDAIVLEFYEAAQDRNDAIIQLSTVVHGYKKILHQKGTYGNASWCHVNINCEIGKPYQDVKRAVAFILNKGKSFCSGTLINNTAQDTTPYFLTASHCLQKKGDTFIRFDPSLFVFVFNYETTDCEGKNAAKTYSVSGASVVATDSISDFALLLLNDRPPAECRPYYAGWSRKDTLYKGVVGIHHPSGDWKKISEDKKKIASGQFVEDDPDIYPDNTHHVVIWDTGSTEGGSSGSGLFTRDGLIIGQLEGGYASCRYQNEADYYGKISYSWTNNNRQDSNRLDYWLDPLGLGVETLKGMDVSGPAKVDDTTLKNTIVVYPNPANGQLTIDCRDVINHVSTVEIYDVVGQLMQKAPFNSPEGGKYSPPSEGLGEATIVLDISHLAAGLYFLKIDERVIKVIKQ